MLRRFLLILCLMAPVTSGAGDTAPLILVLGDSLSAGHGLDQNDGWVALLEQRLARAGYDHRVVNASISGETTRGALSRVEQALRLHHPAIVIVELGGNDGLRGLPLTEIQHNLARLIETIQARGAGVLLAGMRLPPNYGARYTQGFAAIYARLAETYRVRLVPFLLQGLEDRRAYFQADGIHPNKAAQPLILENVWPHLEPMLRHRGQGRELRGEE